MAEARMMFLVAAALVLGSPAAAQTISQGMTTAQVRAALGEPVTVRTAGDWSYLYYLNGCAVRCGSDDVVFVQNDRVVAAVFRTARRRFSGPGAVAALDRADPSRESGLIRSPARSAREAPPIQMRDIRNEPAEELIEGAREEPGRTIIGRPGAGPPARVGGVRVEGEGAPGGRTTIIRREDEAGADRRGSTVRADTAQGAPATAVDDARRARENRVQENTIPRADTTLERRRARERNVAPRAVP
jgi:hypothetical protein